jgi:hypothetical protein
MTDLQTAYPPDYIKLPSAIACADEDDAVLITMARVLGLCWGYKYRKSPPYTPDQLADLLGRPRTTLYRHLCRLQNLHWLRVERRERQIVLQPLIRIAEGQPAAPGPPDQDGDQISEPGVADQGELRAALQEAGIMGRAFHGLLKQKVDPTIVRAWYLWTWAPDQEWMDNPAGYIVNRLREGDEPPGDFLELAQLTPDEVAKLEEAWVGSEQMRGWPSLDEDDKLQRIAPLWVTIHDARRKYRA